MLRKLAVVATVLGLLGLTVSIISPAVSDSRYEERTIRLAEKFSDDDETFVDVGDKDFSAGDYFVFGNDPVYNRARTKQRGTASGSCMAVAIEGQSASVECDVSFYLEGGSLTVEGGLEDSDQGPEFFAPFAVTGGTDDYKSAHGTLEIGEEADGLTFTFKLLL